MAERRMFARTIIDSDAFLDMPFSAQALYFHLAMRADDEGFINNPRAIIRSVNAENADLSILLKMGFIDYESGENLHITHWAKHTEKGTTQKKRNSYAYRKWREKVLKRDGYTCQKCGATDKLHVHHKKSFALFPANRLDINNGITLCEVCHGKMHELTKGVK